MEALETTAEIRKQISIIVKQREQLKDVLEKLEGIEKVYPSDANFILIKVKDSNQTYNDLLRYGIVVRNRHNLPGCENCLRISIGTEQENQALVTALKMILS